MSTPRIVDDIVNAYRETGRRPIRRRWFGEHKEASPFSVYTICYGNIEGRITANKIFEYVCNKFGNEYVFGFVSYWDNDHEIPMHTTDIVRGFRHAKLVENRLKKEGLI